MKASFKNVHVKIISLRFGKINIWPIFLGIQQQNNSNFISPTLEEGWGGS